MGIRIKSMYVSPEGVYFLLLPFTPLFALKNDPSFNSDGDGVGELAVKLYHIIGMYIGQL